jgi:KUP system potassium uptake protein
VIYAPRLHELILPLTLIVLAGLFLVQQAAAISKAFGPVMLAWFSTWCC